MENGQRKSGPKNLLLVLMERHNKYFVKTHKKGYSEVLIERCEFGKFCVCVDMAVMTWRKSSFFAYDPILASIPAIHASFLQSATPHAVCLDMPPQIA